ncbi:Ada metal-binding domain-containing protein [uncultured Sphingomonas sp.]|uniref:bifunctional transcriptional activator/DNA repair enzyme AdaA n=1 Tax=uncultured Sphingomonas sp. TaxID=158754 RepID=UPI0025CB9860|nr:Ada metal-binding domain-containing protein [uncultured Sphingomonas sp.]
MNAHSPLPIDEDAAWDAFARRDRSADGQFVVAVETTGIYCRPSCAARRPRRDHVRFHASAEGARAAGFRACLRCQPDAVARDRQAVAAAIAILEAADEAPPLADLAARVGYAAHHFHRLFKRATGVTPAAYARALRAGRAERALAGESSVTRALYEAGYAGPSRFYADSEQRLGMAPGRWRRGGEGETIEWCIAASPLGPLLIAATARGLARIAFGEDAGRLEALFPAATLRPANVAAGDRLADLIAATPLPDPLLAEPARRTAFIEAVSRAWRTTA